MVCSRTQDETMATTQRCPPNLSVSVDSGVHQEPRIEFLPPILVWRLGLSTLPNGFFHLEGTKSLDPVDSSAVSTDSGDFQDSNSERLWQQQREDTRPTVCSLLRP